MEILLNAIFTFFRGFGFFALTFSYMIGFFLSQHNFTRMGNFLLVDLIVNLFLKNFFSVLMGDKLYPLIGKGKRPLSSRSCGFFIPRKPIKKITESYGMPSGHSQTFAFVATLIYLHLKKKQDNNIYKYILLIVFTLTAMFMRIYIEKCHTVQQTIMGTIIGYMLANTLVKYYGNPFDN